MKNIIFTAAIMAIVAFCFVACTNNDNKSKTEQLAKDEMFTCTMHNEVMSNHEGVCPKCDMKLVKQKMTAEQEKMMKEGTYTEPKE